MQKERATGLILQQTSKRDKRNKSIIPRRAIFDPRMKEHPAVLPMLNNIGSYTNRDGKATVGQARLAEDFGITQQAASKLTGKLVEWGYLTARRVPNPKKPGRSITEWTMLYDAPAPPEAAITWLTDAVLRRAAGKAITWLRDVAGVALDDDELAKVDTGAWSCGDPRWAEAHRPPPNVAARWERLRAVGERVASDPDFAATFNDHRDALQRYCNDVSNVWCFLTRDTGDPSTDYTLVDEMDESERDEWIAELEAEDERTTRPYQLYEAIHNFEYMYTGALTHGDESLLARVRATEAKIARWELPPDGPALYQMLERQEPRAIAAIKSLPDDERARFKEGYIAWCKSRKASGNGGKVDSVDDEDDWFTNGRPPF